MTDKTEATQASEKSDSTGNDNHLPDAILNDVQEEVIDLPRPGIPVDVLNVTKATTRFPDVLIEDK